MTVIDVHTHVVPRHYQDFLARHGDRFGIGIERAAAEVTLVTRHYRGPASGPYADPARRIADLDASGIARQVLSLPAALASTGLPAESGLELARAGNDALAELVSSSGGRFRAFGVAPLRDGELAAREVARARDRPERRARADGDRRRPARRPCAGAVLRSGRGDRRGRLRPPDRSAEPRRAPAAPRARERARLSHRHRARRRGADARRRPRTARPPARPPRARRRRSARGAAASRACVRPARARRALHLDTVAHEPWQVARLIETVGADRVAFGTDYPSELGDPGGRVALAALDPLAPATRERVLSATATAMGLGL